MVGEHHVAALAVVHVQADGLRYRGRQLFLLGFDAKDLIEHITLFFEDQDAIDRFVGRSHIEGNA